MSGVNGEQAVSASSNAVSQVDKEAVEIQAAENLAREAVSTVFLTLCGQADREDRYTGLQREMNMTMVQAVRAAFELGKQTHTKEFKRIEYKMQKSIEKQVEDMKRFYEDKFRGVRAQMDAMCSDLDAQNGQYARSLSSLEQVLKRMKSDLEVRTTELAAAQERCAQLLSDLNTERAQAAACAERLAALAGAAEQHAAEARRAGDLEAAYARLQERWSGDVCGMERHLHEEVARRVDSDERARAAEDAARALSVRLEDLEGELRCCGRSATPRRRRRRRRCGSSTR